jgi:CheY-like chemotaxis protein
MLPFTLPFTSPVPGAANRVAEDGAPQPKPAISQRTILVVDDDPDILDLMSFALEGEGYTVLCASNGAAALELLRTGAQISLIMLDLMMPGMNGWSFLEELSRLPGREPPPVVVVSAAVHHTTPPGVARFLRKPVDLADLYEVASRYSRRPDDRC